MYYYIYPYFSVSIFAFYIEIKSNDTPVLVLVSLDGSLTSKFKHENNFSPLC